MRLRLQEVALFPVTSSYLFLPEMRSGIRIKPVNNAFVTALLQYHWSKVSSWPGLAGGTGSPDVLNRHLIHSSVYHLEYLFIYLFIYCKK